MAGKYDGEVRMRIIIDKGDADSRIMQMAYNFQKTTGRVKQLNSEIREMENQKIPTEEYKNLGKQFDSLVSKGQKLSEKLKSTDKYVPTEEYKNAKTQLEELTAKLSTVQEKQEKFLKTGGNEESTTYKRMQYDVEALSEMRQAVRDEIASWEEDGKEKRISDKWVEIKKEMSEVGAEASKVKSQMQGMEGSGTAFIDPKNTPEYQKKTEELRNATEQADILNQKMNETADKMQKTGSFGENAFGKIKSAVQKTKSVVSSFFSKLTSGSKKASGLLGTFTSRLKGISLSLLVFNWISKGFNAMISSMKAGIQSYAKYSGTFNQTMSEFKTSVANLKNAVGAAVAPLLSMFLPALTTLCSWSGKSTWSKAKSQQVDYAKSLNNTANAAKKAKGALQGFDELNVISSNDSSGSGGGGTSGVSYAEEQIANSISDFAKQLREAFEEGDWKELGTLLGNKFNEIVDEINWSNFGQKIGYSINGAVQTAYRFLKTADFENLGSHIAEFLNAALNEIDFTFIGRLFIRAITSGLDLLLGTLGELDWEKVGQSVGDLFRGAFDELQEWIAGIDWGKAADSFYENTKAAIEGVDFASLAQSFFELLGTALGAAVSFIATIVSDVWDDINQYFQQYLTNDDGTKKTGIDWVLGICQGILDGLKDIGKWIYDNVFKPFIDGFKEAFGIHSPSTVMAEMGGYIIDGLKNGLTGMWDRVKSIVENFKKNIRKAFTDVKENAISVFDTMKEKVCGIFENMWSGIKGIINSILGGVEKMANGVINGLNTMISAMNGLSWDIPEWVPVIGGNKFGLNIPTINNVSLPRLANGGITTGSTLANIGEAGREAVLPLENNLSYLEPLADMIASKMEGVEIVRIVPEESGIFKIVREGANDYFRRTGKSAFNF